MAIDFRQGTIGRLEASFITSGGTLVDQPDFLPTIEIIYIHPELLQPMTAIGTTLMNKIEPGRYFLKWYIPTDQPTTEHQIIYRGSIDDREVIGEDTVTILSLIEQCRFTPSTLQTQVRCC
jgi:hypothetical protein